MRKQTLELAAVGDLHTSRNTSEALRSLLGAVGDRAEVLLLCGDLTEFGLPEETQILANELARTVKIPILAVLGNHDYQSGVAAEVTRILAGVGVTVLDGDTAEIKGVGFVGVKGFAGGFGRRMLEPWGEESIKQFVHHGVEESLKLESALAKLRTRERVVLLHYAPIEATVDGEPREIYPFLGSSRLEEPLNRYEVSMVFHGHAHRGSLEGQTREGVPVYNVAAPLLRRTFPDRPPLRFVSLPIRPEVP